MSKYNFKKDRFTVIEKAIDPKIANFCLQLLFNEKTSCKNNV
jgi:hypothetical protein